MEDNVVVAQHFAYSFRYDLPTPCGCQTLVEDQFLRILEQCPFIIYYLGKMEIATLSGKAHIQSIVWTKTKLTPSQMQAVRNRVLKFYHYDKNTGKYSFASAKKVLSLAAYCTKEEAPLITNLSIEHLEKLPEWTSVGDYIKNKKDELERIMTASILASGYTPSFPQFCKEFNMHYIQIYQRPCCHRFTYFREALKYEVIDHETFLEKIGVLKPSNNSTCNYCTSQQPF